MAGWFCAPLRADTQPPVITDVLISSTPSSVRVQIYLNAKIKYSYWATDEPAALIVEIPGAGSRAPIGPVPVGREPVRQVTTFPSQEGKPARVEIAFSSKAKWTVSEGLEGKRINIEIQTGAGQSGSAVTSIPAKSPVTNPRPAAAADRPKLVPATDALECSFKDADVRDVIHTVADLAGANIVADSSVQGKVTITLTNVGWEEGLGAALKTLGFSLRKDGAVYVVGKSVAENVPVVSVEQAKLTVSAVQADVKQLISIISQKSGLNIVSSPAVDGKVSAQLSSVPVEDGLYTLLSANGYTFRKLQDIYVVDKVEAGKSKAPLRPYKQATSGKVTIDFRDTELSEVLAELSNQTGKNVVTYGQLSEKITMRLVDVTLDEALKLVLAGTKYTSGKVGEVFVVGDATNLASPVAQMLTATEIIPLKYIKADECPRFLSGVIPAANIKPLKEQNALLVVGTAEMIARVKNEIGLIDRVAPQVMIEAQVVEISSSEVKSLGLDFQGASGTISGKLPGIGQIVFKRGGRESASLVTTLQALVNDGRAHVLANPKVCTVNGKEANITISQQRYFRTGYTPPQNGTNPAPYYYPYSQVQSVEAGIMLKIVPFVGASDEITVDIEPEVSNVTGTGPDGLPEVSRRRASTTVRVKDGETIIIGGLKQREESSSVTRTPVLSSIPIIGGLFRSQTKNTREADLMILITPTLITGEQSVGNEAAASSEDATKVPAQKLTPQGVGREAQK